MTAGFLKQLIHYQQTELSSSERPHSPSKDGEGWGI